LPEAVLSCPTAVERVPVALADWPKADDAVPDALATEPKADEKLPEALAPWPKADEKVPVARDNCPTAVELPPVAVALLGHQKFPDPSWLHVADAASAAPDPNAPGVGMAETAIVAPSAVPASRPIRLRLRGEAISCEFVSRELKAPHWPRMRPPLIWS
jgi:hypothetical protein